MFQEKISFRIKDTTVKILQLKKTLGIPWLAQWLGLGAPTAAEGAPGSVAGRGTKVMQAMQHGQKMN